MSSITPAPEIGPYIKQARTSKKMTLDDLAKLSKVSKSMLSQVERGEANPTFAVLWAITQALDVELISFFGSGSISSKGSSIEISGELPSPQIKTLDGACELRILNPPALAGSIEWYDLLIQPGGSLDSEPHVRGSVEHFSALEGDFEVFSGEESRLVRAGQTARYAVDKPHRIVNRSKRISRGLLVLLYGK